jgi:hypothetical protein
MKRMQHPDHGFHISYNQAEEAAMRAAGWTDDDGKALAAKMAQQQPVVEDGPTEADPVAVARAELDALGIPYDGRWGLSRLIAAKG